MSRIGKLPIEIPAGIEVTISETLVKVSKGNETLEAKVPYGISVTREENTLTVVKELEDKKYGALWGTVRAVISNMIEGLSKGFEKKLELVGIGYKAQVSGSDLVLNLGFSHQINHAIPAGLTITVDANTKISIKGADKQVVGQTAAEIRDYRKPEPYKGKGVRYANEYIAMKAGKRSK